ncbi:putative phage tail assembly chaperone [Serratia fonticola]|uniref:Phage tail assembly chaperone n=1 Tax=Serratia fonticola TaxID=47917 RepID=A0AAJ1YC63_SERFO|nr:putative phage tail assembly chaperone [Serratia fonticola]MDQ9126931.1 putative phage tail assembly chaperone [Serratia fonticola]NTY87781.1 hypothetical protein [Serratia fonticola]NTZ13452.1 hypothetical protein [Serratia fonticola]OKP28429.1 hypothetical protein BSQ40_12230 [Serratia fonticola]
MSKENSSIITLTIGTTDVQFQPELVAYNKFLNEATRATDLIGTVRTYLLRIVVPESRDALSDLMLQPGMATQIAEVVNNQYAPKADIQVKQ